MTGLTHCSTLCGIVFLAAGCTPLDGGIAGTPGELGHGTFSYACDSASDPVCDTDSATAHPLPKRVALGSRFSVTYSPNDSGGSATVRSASEEFLEETDHLGSSFKALKPGLAALLARRGQTLADLVHLEITAPDHLEIQSTGEGGDPRAINALEVAPGETLKVRVLAVDEASEMIAGALLCKWTSSDEAVASVGASPADNDISVEGLAEGTATLHVELGELSADVALTVLPGAGGAGGQGGAGGGAGGAGGTGGGGTGGTATGGTGGGT